MINSLCILPQFLKEKNVKRQTMQKLPKESRFYGKKKKKKALLEMRRDTPW